MVRVSRRSLLGSGALGLIPATAFADTPFTSYAFNAAYGTGARTMPDRLSDVKNVKDFGAVGDGLANDTTAIQAAVNWTSSLNRGTIFFPPGTYKVTAPITFNDTGALNICFRGAGQGVSVISGFNVSGYVLDRTNVTPSNQAQVVIEKLSVTNTNTTAGTGCIRLGSTDCGAIRDCIIGGINGITTEDSAGNSSQNILIQDCTMTGNGVTTGTSGVTMGGSGAILGCDCRGYDTGYRMYGSGWSMLGGHQERCNTGILLGLDSAGTDQGASGFSLFGMTTEGNVVSIDFSGTCSGFFISSIAFLSHWAVSPTNSGMTGTTNPTRGMYVRADKATNGVFSAMGMGGDGYTVAACQVDAATSRANLLFIDCLAAALAGGGVNFIFPSNANTMQIQNCSFSKIWTFSQLPAAGGANVLEGDEFNISDSTKGAGQWGQTVAGGGANHALVRYNGTAYTLVGI